MASSGTYTFNPAIADVIMNAYGRIGIRRTDILAEHLVDAANEANLALVMFSNRQPNLWTSELVTQSLTSGVATYTLNARVIMILAAYISITVGSSTVDRIITPISTTEYAALPNKDQSAPPTQYWFNRQSTPQVTLWPVPDSATTYTLKMQCVRQLQDASIPSGVTLDLPYRWLDAFTAELSARLAKRYKPDLEDRRKLDAAEAYAIAAMQDQENVPLYVRPMFDAYYR